MHNKKLHQRRLLPGKGVFFFIQRIIYYARRKLSFKLNLSASSEKSTLWNLYITCPSRDFRVIHHYIPDPSYTQSPNFGDAAMSSHPLRNVALVPGQAHEHRRGISRYRNATPILTWQWTARRTLAACFWARQPLNLEGDLQVQPHEPRVGLDQRTMFPLIYSQILPASSLGRKSCQLQNLQ